MKTAYVVQVAHTTDDLDISPYIITADSKIEAVLFAAKALADLSQPDAIAYVWLTSVWQSMHPVNKRVAAEEWGDATQIEISGDTITIQESEVSSES